MAVGAPADLVQFSATGCSGAGASGSPQRPGEGGGELLDAAEPATRGQPQSRSSLLGQGPQPAGECPRAGSRSCAASSPISAVTRRRRWRSRHGLSPEGREDEWRLDLGHPVDPGHGRVAAVAGSPKPSARSCPGSPGGERPGPVHVGGMGRAMNSARFSSPRAVGGGRPDPSTGTGVDSPRRPADAVRWPGVCGPGRGGLPAERARHGFRTSPRASRCAASSPTPRRWPPACDAGVDPAGHR